MTTDTLTLLAHRRSVSPALLRGPGPTADELQQLLTIAARVPDHKKLVPWRFIVFEGDGRRRAGELFAAAAREEDREPPSEERLNIERQRLTRAPTVVAVVSSYKPHPAAPEWEQILSAGAACQTLVIAANAMGYATNWITEWVSYSPRVRHGLGLAANERIAGFVYIGRVATPPADRERPLLADIVSRWD